MQMVSTSIQCTYACLFFYRTRFFKNVKNCSSKMAFDICLVTTCMVTYYFVYFSYTTPNFYINFVSLSTVFCTQFQHGFHFTDYDTNYKYGTVFFHSDYTPCAIVRRVRFRDWRRNFRSAEWRCLRRPARSCTRSANCTRSPLSGRESDDRTCHRSRAGNC